MNTFLNDKSLLQTFQMLFLWVDNFYFLCIFITCDEQTFDYHDEVWVILKGATKFTPFFSIHMPQILMLKQRPMNF